MFGVRRSTWIELLFTGVNWLGSLILLGIGGVPLLGKDLVVGPPIGASFLNLSILFYYFFASLGVLILGLGLCEGFT